MSDIESELRKLVSSYGYQVVNDTLQSMMKTEYAYLSKLFQVAQPQLVIPAPSTPVAVTVVPVKKQKKIKKVKIIDEPKSEELVDTLVLKEEIKEVVVSNPNPAYRDPKEMKEFQKTEEEKKRKENEEAGIELSQILTKENLKQWIEVEGHTYAWVAREKAGCKESQIAATAQMMGIRSRITKKKALIMSGR